MKYLFAITVLALLLVSCFSFALAEQEKLRNGSDDSSECGNGICEDDEDLEVACPTSNCEGDNCPKCQKACEQDCNDEDESELEDSNEETPNLISANPNSEMRKARIGDKEFETDLEIEESKVNNKSVMHVQLSNRRRAEIKFMPETASSRAIERLGQLNFTIQLKEVGKGNETRLAYEVKAERHYRILALFKTKAQVKAEVDAETGEITSVKKPWWSFLATSSD